MTSRVILIILYIFSGGLPLSNFLEGARRGLKTCGAGADFVARGNHSWVNLIILFIFFSWTSLEGAQRGLKTCGAGRGQIGDET